MVWPLNELLALHKAIMHLNLQTADCSGCSCQNMPTVYLVGSGVHTDTNITVIVNVQSLQEYRKWDSHVCACVHELLCELQQMISLKANKRVCENPRFI